MMIDADKLPLRRIARVRRHQKGGKPWYSRERVCVVMEADLKEEIHRKPRNRLERIQRMSAGEMARFLWELTDGEDRIGFCQQKPECQAALEECAPEVITEENCLKCMTAWLMAEVQSSLSFRG